jgi:predicted enzyme related to lactoylglutathione lyase
MKAIDKISTVTIAVVDQDEALKWFTEKLGFEKRVDMRTGAMRWLTVAPSQQIEVEVLLANWYPDRVGKNPTWVLSTRDCQNAYEELSARGVEFTQKPQVRPYGVEAVFVDLYGNKYALLAPPGEVFTEQIEKTKVAPGPLGVPQAA